MVSKENNSRIRVAVILSLTLGLAPFFPEPHIWGKLRWVWGGAHGMTGVDYFDLVLHGFPWVLLIVLIVERVVRYFQV